MVKKSIVSVVALALSLFLGFSNYSIAEEEGLVGWWKFDEGKGEIAKDFSGKGNDGELRDPIWVKDGLKFNGKDTVFVPASESLDITEEITILAWVKPAMTTKNYNNVLSSRRNSWFFGTTQKDKVHFLVDYGHHNREGGNQTWNIVCISKPCLKANTFSHIAGTFDSETGTAKVYANGECVGSKTGDDVPTKSPGWFSIGGYFPNYHNFNGIIKEVKIYNRVLSAEEIKKCYESKEPIV